jgi:hypothetical protein
MGGMGATGMSAKDDDVVAFGRPLPGQEAA